MSFAHIRGQPRAVDLLRRALAAARLPHTLLFAGPDGVGKRRTALELAKALNCHRAGPAAPADACDACRPCRLVDAGTHPDVLLVAPEGRWLKIAQVREAERHASLTPYAGRRRVVIADAAEAMTEEAANAFLKTLEEPPGGAVVVLVSAAPTSLLPTVRSRCQEVRFGPLPDAVVEELLVEGGLAPAEARRAAALAGGSLALARAWAEGFPPDRQEELLRAVRGAMASAGAALALAKNLFQEYKESRDRVPWLLVLLASWVRDLARPPAGGDHGAPGGGPGPSSVPPAAALAAYDAVARAQEALDRNANLQLALEAMLLRMRRALRGPDTA